MQQTDIDQIKTIVQNFESNKKYIPYFSDLAAHPVFGPLFSSLHPEEQLDIKKIIDDIIVEKIEGMTKTKGGQLFKRFFEVYEDLFRKFRDLNETEEKTKTPEFQTLGKQVEEELFKLEGILTERMLKQEKGLDKVVSSFYDIVYTFFPKMNALQ